jgi:DNA-binding response OmpR family regulator
MINAAFGTIEAGVEGMAPKRILAVDDDAAILGMVAAILRREHYDVDVASGGRVALSMIELNRYDVIVLDLMMPDVSGVDVLTHLHARIPGVKCVVVLSAASSFDVARALNPNVHSTLRKPFDIADLINAVRDCIDTFCNPAVPLDPLKPIAAAA